MVHHSGVVSGTLREADRPGCFEEVRVAGFRPVLRVVPVVREVDGGGEQDHGEKGKDEQVRRGGAQAGVRVGDPGEDGGDRRRQPQVPDGDDDPEDGHVRVGRLPGPQLLGLAGVGG